MIDRRQVLCSVVGMGVAVAGCSESDNPESIPDSTTNETDTRREMPDIDHNQSDTDVSEISIESSFAGFEGSTDPSTSGSSLSKSFDWEAYGSDWSIDLSIPSGLLDYCEQRTRLNDRGQIVSDPYDDPQMDVIAARFRTIQNQQGLSDRQIVDLSLSFVQQMEYQQDSVATGFDSYPKYPLETLRDKGGDCEDSAILLASILQEFGFDSVLLSYANEKHMSLGIKGSPEVSGQYYTFEGDRYYYAETTSGGWEIGEVPRKIQSAPNIQPIRGHPVLVFSWVTGSSTVSYRIQNVGDAPADIGVVSALENKTGQFVSHHESDLGELNPGEESTPEIPLDKPDTDETLRFKHLILTDGTTHDSDVSDWFDP